MCLFSFGKLFCDFISTVSKCILQLAVQAIRLDAWERGDFLIAASDIGQMRQVLLEMFPCPLESAAPVLRTVLSMAALTPKWNISLK